jgi:hypothetical protein
MENNPYGSSPTPASGDGSDFFGGTIVPNAQHSREYADFSVPSASHAPVKKARSVVWYLLAVPVALVLVAGFWAYGVTFGRTSIEMPDTLMGMERMDSTSDVMQRTIEQLKGQTGTPGDVEAAVYQSDSTMLMVMAGEVGEGDGFTAESFFGGIDAGIAQAGLDVSMTAVDPGSRGGDVRCAGFPSAGVCAWVADETFGFLSLAPPTGGDLEKAAQDVRDAIEH